MGNNVYLKSSRKLINSLIFTASVWKLALRKNGRKLTLTLLAELLVACCFNVSSKMAVRYNILVCFVFALCICLRIVQNIGQLLVFNCAL